jgi:hypothetical protein
MGKLFDPLQWILFAALRSFPSGLQHPSSQIMRMLVAGSVESLPWELCSVAGNYFPQVLFPSWGYPVCNDWLMQSTKPFPLFLIWEKVKSHSGS